MIVYIRSCAALHVNQGSHVLCSDGWIDFYTNCLLECKCRYVHLVGDNGTTITEVVDTCNNSDISNIPYDFYGILTIV